MKGKILTLSSPDSNKRREVSFPLCIFLQLPLSFWTEYGLHPESYSDAVLYNSAVAADSD